MCFLEYVMLQILQLFNGGSFNQLLSLRKTQTGGTVHQTETKAQMVLVAASLDNKDQLITLVADRSKILQVYGGSELFLDSDRDSDILLAPKLIDEMKNRDFQSSGLDCRCALRAEEVRYSYRARYAYSLPSLCEITSALRIWSALRTG